MAYCTTAQVESLIPQWPSTTWPAILDPDAELEGIDAEINMALSAQGIAIPFVSDASTAQDLFASWLRVLCRNGVAWRIVRVLFPDADGSGQTPAWAEFRAFFKAGIKGIKDGTMLPQVIADSKNDVDPSTVNTKHGSTDVTDILGAEAKPAFTRRMIDKW